MSDNSQTLAIYNLEFIDIQNEYFVNESNALANDAFINWNLPTINGVNNVLVGFPVKIGSTPSGNIYPDDLFSFSYTDFRPSSS